MSLPVYTATSICRERQKIFPQLFFYYYWWPISDSTTRKKKQTVIRIGQGNFDTSEGSVNMRSNNKERKESPLFWQRKSSCLPLVDASCDSKKSETFSRGKKSFVPTPTARIPFRSSTCCGLNCWASDSIYLFFSFVYCPLFFFAWLNRHGAS